MSGPHPNATTSSGPIPWWSPRMTGQELARVQEVFATNYLNEGDVTECFERRLAAFLGVPHAIAATSGTAALFLALKGLGIGPGDEVIIPDVTFIATANAVTLAGATPVLVDIDPATLCLAPDAVQAALTPRTRAVIPVHVSGRPGTLREILALARARNLRVIEDAAEAFGSRCGEDYLGTLGDAGCFSFSPNKTLTTGQGGVVVTRDAQLQQRLRALKDQGRPVRGTGGDDVHASVGFNFKFTNLQAAVGLAQLDALLPRLQRQRAIQARYAALLGDVAGLSLVEFVPGAVPQWTDALSDCRDALVEFLAQHQVHCRRFWFPIHTQAPYRASDDRFPHSTRLVPQAFWLPSAFTMTDAEVDTVARLVRAFLVGRTVPASRRERCRRPARRRRPATALAETQAGAQGKA